MPDLSPVSPRIAIVGGGPAGLTLARLLYLRGVHAVVFERDAHPLDRPQGGTLDLHDDGGLLALERCGLRAAFDAVARPEDQGTRVMSPQGDLLIDEQDESDAGRPEVDRTALRALLLDSLPTGMVRWNAALQALAPLPDGRWRLTAGSADGNDHPDGVDDVGTDSVGGASEDFDLVVGADGAWSRVRPWLSPYRPQHSGLTFVEFSIDDADRAHPEQSALVGRGKLWIEAPGKSLIVQRNGHAHLRGYAVFRVPADWAARRFDPADPASTRAALLEEFQDFAAPLRDLLRASDDRFAIRPIHALPVGHRWAPRRGLTLIGDAAHLMSPFGGEGVNAAMRDAVELAGQLGQGAAWDTAVERFEAEMFERVLPAAEGSAMGAALHLSHVGQALSVAHHHEVTAAHPPA
ncbi:salicylate hydroxylase [Roseateles aquatilis]|uniref:Flavin-dependent monooxygenase n=1 Tax=Roseateles aquatilis TaxID=431061 RepID=A0A246J8T7_9BURK|nr:NAD(P)/FAD-dependent oxidoreductase [Roseateles aquatilis]OWQ88966.1 salicylate hydroxylase [Roseateles aquatilis]